MKLSQYFLPLIKENPSEAQVVSHRYMLRAGMIRQLSAGIYNWLPLGLKVLKNIENIVREEMDKAGSLELLMPSIQPAELWQESGRYEAYGKEMLRIRDRHERDMLFGPTHEEVITDIFRQNFKSYRDVPRNLYQIQWKFRDEIRPRFGVMRGREFLMKDAYSFDVDYAGAKASYDNMYKTYTIIFRRMGLATIAVSADSGAIGGSMSHEFQVIADTGESQIYYDEKLTSTTDLEEMRTLYAAADEKHDPKNCPIPESQLKTARGIEVGHVFYLGSKYSEAMKATVPGADGKPITMEMGCYGIGVSRLVAAVIEASHDENGIIWPESVSPFKVALINLKASDEASKKMADEAYGKLRDVLYFDTDESAGAKFATADLIGLPWQVIIGPKGAAKGVVELKNRKSGEKQELSLESALSKVV